MLLIMRKTERKPLSFSTTMRNPDRIAGFIECLLPFENQTLTSDVICKDNLQGAEQKTLFNSVSGRNPGV